MALIYTTCPSCKKELVLYVDLAQQPPEEIGTECPGCGAIPVWQLRWEYQAWLGRLVRDEREMLDKRQGAVRLVGVIEFKRVRTRESVCAADEGHGLPT